LFGEDALEALVVAPGEDVRRVVGQADDAQPLLLVVVEVLSAERPLAEVLAEVGGVRAAAAVADDEDEATLLVAVINGVGQGLDLGRVDAVQFLADALQELLRRELDAEHADSFGLMDFLGGRLTSLR